MWLNQFARCDESMEVLRRLQETTLAVTQSWMRLPLQLSGDSQYGELREAVTQWAQAQGRAYQLWLRAFGGKEASASDTAKPEESEQKQSQSLRSKSPAGKARKRRRQVR
jgi:hypothetical protein